MFEAKCELLDDSKLPDEDRLPLKKSLNKILSDFGKAYEKLPDDLNELNAQRLSILFESTIKKIIAKTRMKKTEIPQVELLSIEAEQRLKDRGWSV